MGLAALVLVLAGAACSDGNFADFTGGPTTTAGPGGTTSVPGTGPTTTDGQGVTTTTAEPGPTTTRATTPTSLPIPTAPDPTVPGTGGPVATDLSAFPSCDSGQPLVRLSWAPSGSGEQSIVISVRPDRLDPANATTTQTLAANRGSYDLRETQAGAIYYWRVLTSQGGQWLPSVTAQFSGPTC